MKRIFTLMLITLMVVSCEKDEKTDSSFNYDLGLLYGTWRVTHVEQSDGSFLDVTTVVAEKLFEPTYATFKSDGTYTGKGFFGNGSGTFKASGNTITTYVEKTVYLMYDVVSLNAGECQLVMRDDSGSMKIKCKKQ